MTKSVGVHEAKTHLSRLLEEVADGGQVLISRRGEPIARLVATERRTLRRFGIDRHLLDVPEDFDAPIDEDLL